MDVGMQVAAAIRSYDGLAPRRIGVDAAGDLADAATPDRLAYALGWIAANAIVGAYYWDTALDALPVYHPEQGWDRFLLTRRVSCAYCADEPADSCGIVMLAGDGAPLLTGANGTVRLAVGALLRTDPTGGRAALLEQIMPPALAPGDHASCPHERAALYPLLYAAITELIVAHPGVVAAREVYIDDQQVAGAYHPLYLHGAGRATGPSYDWFAIAWMGRTIFLRIHGERVIYESEAGVWRSEATHFAPGDRATMTRALRTWLRLND